MNQRRGGAFLETLIFTGSASQPLHGGCTPAMSLSNEPSRRAMLAPWAAVDSANSCLAIPTAHAGRKASVVPQSDWGFSIPRPGWPLARFHPPFVVQQKTYALAISELSLHVASWGNHNKHHFRYGRSGSFIASLLGSCQRRAMTIGLGGNGERGRATNARLSTCHRHRPPRRESRLQVARHRSLDREETT
jgi:hypothetical protein